jgi:hypothetical protein
MTSSFDENFWIDTYLFHLKRRWAVDKQRKFFWNDFPAKSSDNPQENSQNDIDFASLEQYSWSCVMIRPEKLKESMSWVRENTPNDENRAMRTKAKD